MKKLISLTLALVFSAMLAMPAFADDTSAFAQKIDQILNNQKQIMDKLDAIQAELDVVKVRATLK